MYSFLEDLANKINYKPNNARTRVHYLPGGFGNVNISVIVNKDSENFCVSTFRGHGDSCGMHLKDIAINIKWTMKNSSVRMNINFRKTYRSDGMPVDL